MITAEMRNEIITTVVAIVNEPLAQMEAGINALHTSRVASVKWLLENYRTLVDNEGNPTKAAAQSEIIGPLDNARQIIQHFTWVILAYKKESDRTSEGALRFRLLFSKYLARGKINLAEVSRSLGKKSKNAYTLDTDVAIEPLMILFFGVDGLPFHI